MASPKRQLIAISKTGSDSGSRIPCCKRQDEHWTRQKQRFPFVERTDCIEMGLTFPHLHSTYCLFVPLSASLPSSSQTFALELSPIRFQRYFYRRRRRGVVVRRLRPRLPRFIRSNRCPRSTEHRVCKAGEKYTDDAVLAIFYLLFRVLSVRTTKLRL